MKRTVREIRGTSITVGGLEVTPLARSVRLILGPGASGFQVHSLRPTVVEIRDGDGALKRMRIPDMRRWSRLGGLLLVPAVMMARRSND